MSDSIKKETEVNELLNEVDDLSLGDEAGASVTTVTVTVTVTPVVLSRSLNCGIAWSVSAECRKDHKSCI